MLRNFVKKPTFVSNANSENDMDASGFNLKRGSKQTSNRMATPLEHSAHEFDEDGEIVEKKIVYRPKTPDIDEEMLSGFDMRT